MRLGWLALLTLCCALFSLGVGRFQVPMTHSLMILLEPFTGQHYAGIDAIQRQVILGVRVPRVLLAMGAGAARPLAARWLSCSACRWRRCCCRLLFSAWRRCC